jgi:hypothetical protein
MGLTEVAAHLGVPRNTVGAWQSWEKLPKPFAHLAMGASLDHEHDQAWEQDR